MHEAGWLVALWAIMVPIIMMLLFFVPPYALSILSLWNVYGDQALSYWDDVSLVLHNMESLYYHWEKTPELTMTNFFLPVFAPIIIGFGISLTLMYLFYRYIREVFHVS